MKLTNKQTKNLWDIVILAVIAGAIFFMRHDISGIIPPFIYALVLSYFLNPLIKMLEKRKIKRVYAILLVFVGIFLLIYLLFLSFVPTLVREVRDLANEVPNIIDFIQQFFQESQLADFKLPAFLPDGFFDFLDIDSQLGKLSDILTQYISSLPSAIFGAMKSLLNLIMTPLITFYYLKDKERFSEALLFFFNKEGKEKVKEGARRIDEVLGGFIRGQLLVAAFVGTLTGLGSWIIGIPNATIVGLVSGLTNIIPYFGPFLGGILPVILGLMNEPIMALWVLILIVVIQQIEGSFLSPQIMSHSVGLHPLAVMFSVLLFGSAFGVAGMILGVPIAGTIKVLFSYALEYRQKIREENISMDLDEDPTINTVDKNAPEHTEKPKEEPEKESKRPEKKV
ncbi:AI-2E family transporter [Alkalibacter rhizosphaerae]|uniref:AI-2E family transporter n=1 Tax=Alkalibacter rhizosphaerae TaxID=2815577 RepID=A0A975AI08_9FIRM|nr:AI-2E family transporter [Alkalibacter rhizosphaerae]QSX09169.1 AI-2E family transporter [Alkalibacter rhizosphaerae]